MKRPTWGERCPPCAEAAARWLDYRPSPTLSIAYGSGAAYDASPRGIADAKRARFELWRDTVRWHQQHIRDLCDAGSHVSESPSPSRRSVSVPSL